MKKMQKMIAVLFSVAMCAAMAVPAFAAETDTARNEEQETVMPRAIVYEEINIPGDGKFYKITDDFDMHTALAMVHMSCSPLVEREAWTLQQLRYIHCMLDR